MVKDLAIIGAGGFGREVKVLIDDINEVKKTYNIKGFFDDGLERGYLVNGLPVLGKISDINQHKEKLSLVIAIGTPKAKKNIYSQIKNENIDYPNLIHPTARISKDDVCIGKGNVVCAGNIITCNISLDDFIILNLSCTVGHDTKIKSYCSFMPSVNISGEVHIEESVYVGTGAKIINQLEIGEGAIIGAGAVVAKSLPKKCTAVGIPAKPIKFHE